MREGGGRPTRRRAEPSYLFAAARWEELARKEGRKEGVAAGDDRGKGGRKEEGGKGKQSGQLRMGLEASEQHTELRQGCGLRV